jgi:hypothetical protein
VDNGELLWQRLKELNRTTAGNDATGEPLDGVPSLLVSFAPGEEGHVAWRKYSRFITIGIIPGYSFSP